MVEDARSTSRLLFLSGSSLDHYRITVGAD